MATRRTAAPLTAYVLHHHDWSESSLVLELYSRELGRLVAIAKGAKRPHSQLRAVLLPLQRLQIQLGRHKGDELPEVHLLRSAEWAGGSAMPGGDALLAGLSLNELLLRALLRHEAQPRLFDAYAASLDSLAQAHRRQIVTTLVPPPRDPEAEHAAPAQQIGAVLRAFELQLLQHMGLLPQLDRITQTQQPLQSSRLYRLGAESGLRPLDPDESGSGLGTAQLAALQAALDAADLAALQQACRQSPAELRLQLHGLLHYHLGQQPLRTRHLMRELQRLTDATPHLQP